jgi:AraC family transcriptional regulator, regulatory protein of adaptative response / methylphosphotriester-DNA alkyltransferase methyltransferase
MATSRKTEASHRATAERATRPASESGRRSPGAPQRAHTAGHRESIYRDAVAIVEAEYATRLCVEDVARRVFSSRRQLQRVYAEIGGTSFRQHLTAVRMQRAGELLATDVISVREAARRVAYPHPARFAQTFFRYHGVTPSAFRPAMREQRPGSPVLALVAAPLAEAVGEPALASSPATIALEAIDRRVTYVLRLLDSDGDDILHALDVEEWVDRLGALRDWEPGSDGYSALTDLFLNQGYHGLCAAAGRSDSRITLRAMREGMLSVAREHPARLIAWADALFDVLDERVTGRIGVEEYRDLLSSLCVAHAAADVSFRRIDVDGRGQLSRSEFSALYLGFFLDGDPEAAAAWLWGAHALSPRPERALRDGAAGLAAPSPTVPRATEVRTLARG